MAGIRNFWETIIVLKNGALRIIGGAGDYGSPANGMFWYNTSTNKARVYENGAWQDVVDSGSGAPSTAHYFTSQAEAGLSNEVNFGALTTGLLKHTVAAGVSTPATAVAGTDYYNPGGTDVALADGGTGASLADPGVDRILFWDNSLGAVTWLEVGSGLSITGTVLTASAASSAETVIMECRNGTGSSIGLEQWVYISGYDSGTGLPEISKADASAEATARCIGITISTFGTAGATGFVVIHGNLSGPSTLGFSDGDILYLSTTAGDATNTPPTGAGEQVVPIAIVTQGGTSNGQVLVRPQVPKQWKYDAGVLMPVLAQAGVVIDSDGSLGNSEALKVTGDATTAILATGINGGVALSALGTGSYAVSVVNSDGTGIGHGLTAETNSTDNAAYGVITDHIGISDYADFDDNTGISAPPSGKGRLYAGGVVQPSWIQPSGLDRQLQGLVYQAQAASSAITNTMSETAFNTFTFTFPADALTDGMCIRGRAYMRAATTSPAGPNLTLRLKLDGITLATCLFSSLLLASTTDGLIEYEITIVTTGASGTASACMQAGFSRGLPVIGGSGTAAVGSVDTTNTCVLEVTAQWSATSMSNTISLYPPATITVSN